MRNAESSKKELKNAVLCRIFEREKDNGCQYTLFAPRQIERFNQSNATEQISAKGEGKNLFLESNALLQIHSN
jgi:hypothetical protein